jgi:hypothetical protein
VEKAGGVCSTINKSTEGGFAMSYPVRVADRFKRQSAGLFTSSKSMTISGIVPGKTYTFQVRGVGGSTRYSDWSNSVSRMCV